MARPLNVRRPTTREVRRLSRLMAGGVNRHRQRRAEALLLYGMGVRPLRIAEAQAVHVNTIYADLHAFAAAGIGAIEQLQSAGAPARLTANQEARIVRLAEQSPGEVGQPYGRWSLRKLSTYLVKAHVVKAIGRERLRQVLKKRCPPTARPAQAHRPGSPTAGHPGADPLDFPAFAASWTPRLRYRAATVRFKQA
jgi:transposase